MHGLAVKSCRGSVIETTGVGGTGHQQLSVYLKNMHQIMRLFCRESNDTLREPPQRGVFMGHDSNVNLLPVCTRSQKCDIFGVETK